MGVRIALDATYAAEAQPSGVGIYSRRILDGLAERYPKTPSYSACGRRHIFASAGCAGRMSSGACCCRQSGIRADLYHALNQRVDRQAGSASRQHLP